jgi:hypothetical protein
MNRRFKTGELCPKKATYVFDGYVDTSRYISAPTANEKEIPLERDEVFPPIRSQNEACWRVEK